MKGHGTGHHAHRPCSDTQLLGGPDGGGDHLGVEAEAEVVVRGQVDHATAVNDRLGALCFLQHDRVQTAPDPLDLVDLLHKKVPGLRGGHGTPLSVYRCRYDHTRGAVRQQDIRFSGYGPDPIDAEEDPEPFACTRHFLCFSTRL